MTDHEFENLLSFRMAIERAKNGSIQDREKIKEKTKKILKPYGIGIIDPVEFVDLICTRTEKIFWKERLQDAIKKMS